MRRNSSSTLRISTILLTYRYGSQNGRARQAASTNNSLTKVFIRFHGPIELQQRASMHPTRSVRFSEPNAIVHGRDSLGRTVCLVRRDGKSPGRQSCEYYELRSYPQLIRPCEGQRYDGPERTHNSTRGTIHRR